MMFFRMSLLALFVVAVSAQTDASREALFAALQRGAAGEVERVLSSGVSPNVVDAEGISALMTATLFADAKTVELLLKHGADPNRADASGATALMWAVPDVEKVRLLLAHGANVNARSDSERTPLLVAAAYPGTMEVLRLLLARGADLRAQDRAGTTADRKSTRLNSSHITISYAVFCLKKKNNKTPCTTRYTLFAKTPIIHAPLTTPNLHIILFPSCISITCRTILSVPSVLQCTTTTT